MMFEENCKNEPCVPHLFISYYDLSLLSSMEIISIFSRLLSMDGWGRSLLNKRATSLRIMNAALISVMVHIIKVIACDYQ